MLDGYVMSVKKNKSNLNKGSKNENCQKETIS